MTLTTTHHQILAALDAGPATARQVAAATGQSLVRARSQLAKLTQAGHLEATRRDGAFTYARPGPKAETKAALQAAVNRHPLLAQLIADPTLAIGAPTFDDFTTRGESLGDATNFVEHPNTRRK